MHACMCQCIMCAMCQFSPFVFKFQIKKNQLLNIFYGHACKFLCSETFVCSYPYVFIHVSYISMLEHLSILCVPMFLCSYKIMN